MHFVVKYSEVGARKCALYFTVYKHPLIGGKGGRAQGFMLFPSIVFLFAFLPGTLLGYYILLRWTRTGQNIVVVAHRSKMLKLAP